MSTVAFIANHAFNCTPTGSDISFTTPVVIECNGLAGDIKVDTKTATGVTYPIKADAVFRCLVTKIYNTGTTATILWAYEV